MRLHYENDYFSGTDYYYTQGINLEFVHPAINKFLFSRLLVRSHGKESKFGIALEHLGYTPTRISHTEILAGDRPFAASIFLKTFSVINDPLSSQRIVSSLSTGIIGPWAGGQQMQTAIHRWIHDRKPTGWSNQIHNDVVLNYQMDIERSLFSYKEYFLLTGKVGGRVGTLSDKGYGSAGIMVGFFDNPFKTFSKQKASFQIYLFLEPQINVIGFDASLQGGIFNRSSPYKITSGGITRIVFQNNAGMVVKIGKCYLEYFQSFLTKEFDNGKHHQWGGVRIGWYFTDKLRNLLP